MASEKIDPVSSLDVDMEPMPSNTKGDSEELRRITTHRGLKSRHAQMFHFEGGAPMLTSSTVPFALPQNQRAARERLASSSQRATRGDLEVRGDLRLDLFQGIGGGREAPSCQKQGAETEKTHPEVQRRERAQRIER